MNTTVKEETARQEIRQKKRQSETNERRSCGRSNRQQQFNYLPLAALNEDGPEQNI
jgi:hypothetical protein